MTSLQINKISSSPRKKIYLNLRNRFSTSFLQFKVKTALKQIYIYIIIYNNIYLKKKKQSRNF